MNTKNKKRKPGNKRRSSTRNTKNEGITTIYFPIVPYACGLRIAENIGALALESYRKRIAAPIAALDAEDKGFWDWAVAGQIPVTKTTTSGRANHLLHSGVVWWLLSLGKFQLIILKLKGLVKSLSFCVCRKFLPKGKL